MTTSQSRNLRKAGAVALSLALAMSTLAITPASAAKKVKLAKTKITVNVGKTKTVKIKNVKKKQVKKLTVKSSKAAVAKAKASKKTAIKVTGKKAGSAKVTANLKLKKKVGGKKAYKLTLKVTVKKAAPAPTAAPTVAPTAAPTPVVSGSSIALDKPTGYKCSVKGAPVTVTANIVPATSNEEVKWEVDKPELVTVTGQSTTVNGVATCQIIGVKDGTATITAKIDAGSASAPVTVEKEVIAAKIVNGKQTKANAVEVYFDIDYKTDNQGFDKTKFDVDVYNTAGQITKTIPVNNVAAVKTAPASGSGAVLTLDSAFSNNDKVVVNLYKDKEYASKFDFTASVGDPVQAKIGTTEAEQNVQTPVNVELYDANGIDVTSTVDVDNRVVVKITGDGIESQNETPSSKANLTMNTVNAKATVTAEYTKSTNTSGTPDFTGQGQITCIKPIPKVGDRHFKKYAVDGVKSWGGEDKVAKFYKGKDAESVEAVVGQDVVYSFYASTQDDAKDAISYDEYSVSSSNGDVASATCDRTGKFTNITITGVKVGTCNINVKATKNTASTNYVIPVVVKAKGKFTQFSVTPKRSNVSNAIDTTYQSENGFTITAKDDLGNDLTKDPGFEISFEISKPAAADIKSQTYKSDGGSEIELNGKFGLVNPGSTGCTYNAAGALAGSYTIHVKAEYDGVAKEANPSVTVNAVPSEFFVKGGTAITYSIDTDRKTINTSNTLGTSGDDTTSTSRIIAKAGSTFVGYVSPTTGKIGSWKTGNDTAVEANPSVKFVTAGDGKFATTTSLWTTDAVAGKTYFHANLAGANKDTKLAKIYSMVQNGTKWGTGSGTGTVTLNDRDNNFKGGSFATKSAMVQNVTLNTYGGTGKVYYTDTKYDPNYAKAGSVTVRFGLELAKDYSVSTQDVTVKVVDNMFKPKVSVENRTLEDFTENGVKSALKVDVDLNSNSGNEASVKGIKGAANGVNKFKEIDYTKSSVTAHYVQVSEDEITYYVQLGASFNKK